jgi:hypothetical protein
MIDCWICKCICTDDDHIARRNKYIQYITNTYNISTKYTIETMNENIVNRMTELQEYLISIFKHACNAKEFIYMMIRHTFNFGEIYLFHCQEFNIFYGIYNGGIVREVDYDKEIHSSFEKLLISTITNLYKYHIDNNIIYGEEEGESQCRRSYNEKLLDLNDIKESLKDPKISRRYMQLIIQYVRLLIDST